jgi:hypothetical protein
VAPELRAALLALLQAMRERLSAAEIERLIRTGQVEQIVAALREVVEAEAKVARVREGIRTVYRRSAEQGIRTLPFARSTTVNIAFDFLNPRVVDAIQTLESRALSTLADEQADTVRQVVHRGIEAGVNPRALVPQLRNAIGLAPNQELAVENYRRALLDGDFAKARGYALRDKRSDPVMRRLAKDGGTLTEAQVERMTAAYRKGWQGFNAETHARTAALDASRAGQRASWEAAIEQGGLDRSRMMKRWVATMDDRTRPEHEAAHGIEVQIDELFPVDGGVQVPGENAYNCRCVALYRYELRKAA